MILILFYRLLSDVRLEAQFNDLPLIYTHDLYGITFHLIFSLFFGETDLSSSCFQFSVYKKKCPKIFMKAPALFESIFSNKLKSS
jgi:hypothetical protein